MDSTARSVRVLVCVGLSDSVKYRLICIVICLLLSSCIIALPDNADAVEDSKTISGQVSVPSQIGTEGYETNIDKLSVLFVSETHTVFSDVNHGTYSAELKIGTQYSVRCFNADADEAAVFTGDPMSFLFYGTLTIDDTVSIFDIALENGVEYVDAENGAKYYVYNSLKIATLIELPVQYEIGELTAGRGNNKTTYQAPTVKDNQTITIPEYINGEHKVTFVGNTFKYAGMGVIHAPITDKGTNLENKVYSLTKFTPLFQDPNGPVVNIIFNGPVILNAGAFFPTYPSLPTGITNPITRTSTLNFNITFEKDVYVNSYRVSNIIRPASDVLSLIKDVAIFGVYHGGINVDANGNCSQIPGYASATNIMDHTNFSAITFSDKLTFDRSLVGSIPLSLSNIDKLGVLPNSKFTVEPTDNGSGYTIKEGETGIITSISNVTSNPEELKTVANPITLAIVNGNSVTYSLVTKDTIIVLDVPKAPASLSFVGWFTDSAKTVAYDENSAATSNLTLYAKFRIDTCTVNLNVDDSVNDSISGLAPGSAITLPAVLKDGQNFNGWKVNGILLGAQYIVSVNDADELGVIDLIASFSPIEKTSWNLTASGEDVAGKVFWSAVNSVGSYGIVTVIPSEFEKASVSIDPAVDGAYVGKLSDNTYMVYSANGEDVTVAVAFESVEKASEYTVSLVEIAKEGSPGFRATVAATDGGIVDTSGKLSIRYVYKVMDEASGLWCFTTSGQTTGVDDYVVPLGGANDKAYSVTGNFYLNSIEATDGAYLVYGYASYAFGDSSVTAETIVVTSPVIMSVSEIQAVVSKS